MIFNNNIIKLKNLSKSYGDLSVLKKINLDIDVGEKIAIIGENGIGKTTLLSCLVGDEGFTNGEVKWSENVRIGYFAQNHGHEFKSNKTLFDWMSQWGQKEDDLQVIRGTLGRLLFSQDDIEKPVSVLSGGEQRRMLFGKIILQRPNLIIMDEPTNHLDMESIESLNSALGQFEGTLIVVSHDREFVSSLATRIIELTPDKISDYGSGYEDYLLANEAN